MSVDGFHDPVEQAQVECDYTRELENLQLNAAQMTIEDKHNFEQRLHQIEQELDQAEAAPMEVQLRE